MRKIVLLSILFFNFLHAKSQTIGYLDLPVNNELWIEFKDTIGANFAISTAGAGQSWNYANSFNVHDTITILHQSPSSTPTAIASLFPQANLASAGPNNGDYNFYKTDFTGMYLDGFYRPAGVDIAGFNFTSVNYINNLLLIPVPFNFGDVVQNTSTFEYIFPDSNFYPGANIRLTESIFQDLEMESQGQLVTPLGSYPNIFRIKEMTTKTILFEIDSFAVGNYYYLTDQTYPTTYSYKWFKSGPNALVMSAQTNEFEDVISASYFTSSGLVSDQNKALNSSIAIMPNPVNQGNSVNVLFNKLNATAVILCDLSGREVHHTQVNKGISNVMINTADLESGIYFVKVYQNNELLSTSKMLIN
jgi:hypothetical protein